LCDSMTWKELTITPKVETENGVESTSRRSESNYWRGKLFHPFLFILLG
jgi:hypothetical protein